MQMEVVTVVVVALAADAYTLFLPSITTPMCPYGLLSLGTDVSCAPRRGDTP